MVPTALNREPHVYLTWLRRWALPVSPSLCLKVIIAGVWGRCIVWWRPSEELKETAVSKRGQRSGRWCFLGWSLRAGIIVSSTEREKLWFRQNRKRKVQELPTLRGQVLTEYYLESRQDSETLWWEMFQHRKCFYLNLRLSTFSWNHLQTWMCFQSGYLHTVQGRCH